MAAAATSAAPGAARVAGVAAVAAHHGLDAAVRSSCPLAGRAGAGLGQRAVHEPAVEGVRRLVDVLANDHFLYHAQISLSEFGLGFALAVVVSIPLGVLLGTSRYARYILDPPLMALYMAPTLILLPILMIWLGIGMASKVAVVFLGAIFPIIVNTMAGMREADPKLIQAARCFGANKLDVFVRILIPGSLPAILMGMRLAVGRGVLGVVVGELYASQAGIGHQLMKYGSAMRIDRLLVYAIIISVFGYPMTSLVRLLKSRVQSWRAE